MLRIAEFLWVVDNAKNLNLMPIRISTKYLSASSVLEKSRMLYCAQVVLNSVAKTALENGLPTRDNNVLIADVNSKYTSL